MGNFWTVVDMPPPDQESPEIFTKEYKARTNDKTMSNIVKTQKTLSDLYARLSHETDAYKWTNLNRDINGRLAEMSELIHQLDVESLPSTTLNLLQEGQAGQWIDPTLKLKV